MAGRFLKLFIDVTQQQLNQSFFKLTVQCFIEVAIETKIAHGISFDQSDLRMKLQNTFRENQLSFGQSCPRQVVSKHV